MLQLTESSRFIRLKGRKDCTSDTLDLSLMLGRLSRRQDNFRTQRISPPWPMAQAGGFRLELENVVLNSSTSKEDGGPLFARPAPRFSRMFKMDTILPGICDTFSAPITLTSVYGCKNGSIRTTESFSNAAVNMTPGLPSFWSTSPEIRERTRI